MRWVSGEMKTNRAGQEHIGREEGRGGGGRLDEDVEVAVHPQQPLDRVRHVKVGQLGRNLFWGTFYKMPCCVV